MGVIDRDMQGCWNSLVSGKKQRLLKIKWQYLAEGCLRETKHGLESLRMWSEVKEVDAVSCLAVDLHDLHCKGVFATCIENLSIKKPHNGKCSSSTERKNTPCWPSLCGFRYPISKYIFREWSEAFHPGRRNTPPSWGKTTECSTKKRDLCMPPHNTGLEKLQFIKSKPWFTFFFILLNKRKLLLSSIRSFKQIGLSSWPVWEHVICHVHCSFTAEDRKNLHNGQVITQKSLSNSCPKELLD